MSVASMLTGVTAYKLYIGGEWREASSGERIAVINPATGERIAEIAAATVVDVDAAAQAASAAFADGRWSGLTPGQRSDILHAAG